jgi:hypothetical protein
MAYQASYGKAKILGRRVANNHNWTALSASADVLRVVVIEDTSIRLPLLKWIPISMLITNRVNPSTCFLNRATAIRIISREKSFERHQG